MSRSAIASPVLIGVMLAVSAAPSQAQRLRVGEEVDASLETPHPYPDSSLAGAPVWTQTIYHPGASYIAPHFSRFELGPGDYVVVRSPDGSRSWTFDGYGRGVLGRGEDGPGFWGIHIRGERAVVELFGAGSGQPWGFRIDKYARGFTAEEMGGGATEQTAAICTGDDKENAICFKMSEPDIYDKARAVGRLLIAGTFFCTGWLLGDEGHIMTNQHCIENINDALNTDYDFMAEAKTCETNCPPLGCAGTIEFTTATLIQSSVPLDYSLVLPAGNVSGTYGFLQLRDTGARLDERIYSPQHPRGRGKEIAVFSTYPENPSGFAEVDSLTEPVCGPTGTDLEVGYFMDTEGGSSGSAVLGFSDNLVIALHHCQGSSSCETGDLGSDDPNRGVDIVPIINDLGPNLPHSAIGSDSIFSDGFESGDTSAWDRTIRD